MNARELRSYETFQKSTKHVTSKNLEKRSKLLANSCAELEGLIPQLWKLHEEVHSLKLKAQKEANVKRWRNRLRNVHLLPLRYTAWAKLKIKLAVPHKEARNDAQVAAGVLFERELRPHLPALVKAGFEDDCLEALLATTNQLKRWTTEVSSAKLALTQAKGHQKRVLREAREALDVMHGAMLTLIADDPSLENEWLSASKLPGRIGHVRETGGHLKYRPAKPKDAPGGKPDDFDAGAAPGSDEVGAPPS